MFAVVRIIFIFTPVLLTTAFRALAFVIAGGAGGILFGHLCHDFFELCHRDFVIFVMDGVAEGAGIFGIGAVFTGADFRLLAGAEAF